ncbi:MAG: carboxypeptidase-like regulatory domain-containing protein [Prevotella sp.]|nr:carboxypeptidase-like regulatory domain-containing protein [Prevotella sp.]
MDNRRTTYLLLFLLLAVLPLRAQISGYVIDGETGDSIPYASVMYKGHNIAVASNLGGYFTIARHDGWQLTFSAVGYVQKTITVNASVKGRLTVKLKPDTRSLKEVTVKTKRRRYSRKNNPAVELMRKVIERKKQTDLDNRDYYQYNKYQKITLALNEITKERLESPKFKKAAWLKDQVEMCQYNKKLILPLSVDETVTQKIYRKSPHTEKNIVKGQNSTGVNDLFQTGDILTTTLKDVFTDVNIYDDQVRLLQYPFTSPIGKGAIAFYRYYIEDTVYVDRDKCIHLHFLPNNQQDFGFRGDIYIMDDSSYQVKRCELTIPKKSDVNFVENLKVEQEFTMLPDSTWVLTVDDMIAELKLASFIQKAIVIRTTRLSDYAFDELPKQLFKGKAREVKEADAMMRDDAFWDKYRQVHLTKSESKMDAFVHNLEQIKGFKYIIFGAKAFIENFVETGNPSKVDIGPINTMLTSNFVDGTRTRISAQSTANLNKHWFFSGYAARGWDSHKNYYKGEITYSFNKKEYLPREFPKRTLTFMSTYDVCSPSDKFMHTDKDNVFTSFKWSTVDKMMFYNKQELTFEREEDWGFKTTVGIKTEENVPCGELYFRPLSTGENIGMRTTEVRAELRFAPGETYINTKQRRLKINLDAPVFIIGHTMGLKDVLGGDYRYNYTEASIYKRFWMNSWGKIDCYVRGGVQWNKVPFPLLCMPATNLSYIIQDFTFQLINNMEFLNDRFVSADVSWDLNGKIFNRIPLIKKLKWREYIAVKCLWGDLSDKNNPYLPQNSGDAVLMEFPEGSYVMNPKTPYVELSLGIHNIFKLVHVEYVRRLNYLDLPTANKHGVRFMIRMTF